MKVLIVDDIALNRKLLRAILAAEGHSVLDAEDGLAALEILERETIDAVISDILMPRMDGYRLCYEIRKNQKLKAIPFIAYTSTYTSPLDEKVALDFGADKFIIKPAPATDILSALHEVMQNGNGRRAKQLQEPQELLAMREYSEALVRKLEESNLELTEANSALAESESHLRTILDSEPDCVKIINPDGALVELNHAGLRMFEADSPEQLVGKSVYPFVVPDHRQAFHEITEAVLRGESRRMEFEIVGLKGTRRWLETHAVPLKNANGEIISSLGITRDITESKRAEEALRQIPLEETQRGRAKIIKDVGIIFVLSVVVFVAAQHFELFETFSHWVLTYRETVLDELLIVLVFLTFASGFFSYRRWKGLKVEVTARKKAQAALRALHGELEMRVQERTADLAKSNEMLRTEIAERKRAQEMVQLNLERIQALHEIDVAINSTLDLNAVLQVLLEKIEVFLPFPAATTVRLGNRATGKFENTACRSTDERAWKAGSGREIGELSIEILKAKAPVMIHDIQTDPQMKASEFFRKQGFVSYLGVPLTAKDEVLGILGFYTKEAHEFTQQEIHFLLTLAGQAAIAIHNSQLFVETERRRHEAEELARVAQFLTETLDITAVGERIVTSVQELFSVRGATLRLLQPDGSFSCLVSAGEVFSQDSEGRVGPSDMGIASRVITERRPIWSADTLNEPEIRLNHQLRDYQIRSPIRSMMVAPLRAHDKLIGALELSDQTGRTYSDSEVALLQTFADQAALALQKARLHDQTEHHLKRIEALREIDKAITSTLSLTNVLEILLERVERSCSFAAASGVALLESESQKLVPLATRNIPLEEWKADIAQSSGNLSETLRAAKSPVTVSNLERDPRTNVHTFARQHALVSCMGIPLVVKDEFIGTLVIYTKEEHAFNAEEIEFCTALGSQAAIAIHNAKLFLQTERHLKRIEALREIDKAITSTLDLQAVLDLLLDKIDIFLPVRAATTIRLFNTGTGQFENTTCRGIDERKWKAGRGRKTGQLSKEVFETNSPLIIGNIQKDTQMKAPEFFRKQGFVSYLGVPLIAKNNVIAILGFYTKAAHEFTQQEMDFLLTLAGQAAIAIHNAQLFEEIGHSNAELEKTTRYLGRLLKQLGGLYTALTPISPTSSTEEVMDGIIDRIMDATDADAALIRVWDKNASSYPIIGQRGFPDDYLKRTIPASRGGAVDWVIRNGEPIIAPDIASEPRLIGKAQVQLGLRSCALLPLKVHDEVRGVIHVSSRRAGYFDDYQRDHLLAIARQLGFMLENREYFYDLKSSRDELERANKVKDEFLGVVSHELRTPVNLIMGFTNLLKERAIEREDGLKKISSASSDLLAMVDSILHVTLLEANQLTVGSQEFSLASLLAEVRASYDATEPNHTNLVWNYADDLPPIKTDRKKLKQILNNLIHNALKFTEQGKVTLSARLFHATSNGQGSDAAMPAGSLELLTISKAQGWIEFKVADTGVGIPADALPKIFDKFYQADSSQSRHYGGAGLGLYIVKKFTDLLGGKVEVESEIGRGSTFTVTLPADH
jgi:PAS domain S-box-containing protein